MRIVADAGRVRDRLTLVLVAAVCLTAGSASAVSAQTPSSKWQAAIDATWADLPDCRPSAS